MIFGFDTDDKHAATASLVLYAIWRSRDRNKLKITPEIWGQIERAVKSVAKRSRFINEFMEKLKVKLKCSTISPRWAATGGEDLVTMLRGPGGELRQVSQERREFLTGVLAEADDRAVLDVAYRQTAYVVLLVRDRLEREKPFEADIVRQFEEAETVDAIQ